MIQLGKKVQINIFAILMPFPDTIDPAAYLSIIARKSREDQQVGYYGAPPSSDAFAQVKKKILQVPGEILDLDLPVICTGI